LLKAGFQAPSAYNLQPWHYVVVKEKETLEKIADIHPYAKMLPQAGCGIVVCGIFPGKLRKVTWWKTAQPLYKTYFWRPMEPAWVPYGAVFTLIQTGADCFQRF